MKKAGKRSTSNQPPQLGSEKEGSDVFNTDDDELLAAVEELQLAENCISEGSQNLLKGLQGHQNLEGPENGAVRGNLKEEVGLLPPAMDDMGSGTVIEYFCGLTRGFGTQASL